VAEVKPNLVSLSLIVHSVPEAIPEIIIPRLVKYALKQESHGQRSMVVIHGLLVPSLDKYTLK
jgi:hypothetical protein